MEYNYISFKKKFVQETIGFDILTKEEKLFYLSCKLGIDVNMLIM